MAKFAMQEQKNNKSDHLYKNLQSALSHPLSHHPQQTIPSFCNPATVRYPLPAANILRDSKKEIPDSSVMFGERSGRLFDKLLKQDFIKLPAVCIRRTALVGGQYAIHCLRQIFCAIPSWQNYRNQWMPFHTVTSLSFLCLNERTEKNIMDICKENKEFWSVKDTIHEFQTFVRNS